MPDQEHRKRLDALDDRIAALKGKEQKPHQEEHYSQANMAWRMVIELVSGLGIGFGIGYGLDSLFGTLPILLVVFTLLGFAAGVQTMMRTANELQRTKSAEAAGEEKRTEDGD
ncbi:AtpZ/AtpI family protein [Primorskyibacter aestuariivivens]|uniref:AtpZ/AtpI family protein n=1 Tax=Primorskyibacter aestuariivivens TaxID=1888912 RepID=UPI0023016B61|nr:AtpZ/AtpI family protein [Primorskyibacter aestuariivivens]MDA7428466.1 AtpZ/AtpI family protein [Primorskyibacter aestuariivivens]